MTNENDTQINIKSYKGLYFIRKKKDQINSDNKNMPNKKGFS